MKVIEMLTDSEGITEFNSGGSMCLSGSSEWERNNLKPNTRYACPMIEIPKGMRLVTDEEKDKYDKPLAYSHCQGASGCWSNKEGNYGGGWTSGLLYCVDEDYQFEKPLPVIKLTIDGKSVELSPESIKAIQELTK